MSAFARLLGTFFYLGYIPGGPGTAGSLGALAVAWVLHSYAGISAAWLAFFGALLMAPAIWAAGRIATDTGSKDPQIVVIDEVVGQWRKSAKFASLSSTGGFDASRGAGVPYARRPAIGSNGRGHVRTT